MVSLSYEDFLDKNKYYTQEEFLEEYGESYKVYASNTLLIKDEELFNSYKNTELISLQTQIGTSTVSQKLILDLLTDEGLYRYLLDHMTDDKGIVVRMSLVKDGQIGDAIKVTRDTLAKAIAEITQRIEGKIPNKVQLRMALLTNTSSVYSLNMNYKNYIHTCLVDGEICEVASLDLYNILNKSEEEFNTFINETEEVEFTVLDEKRKYPKRVVVYMLIDFIESQRILENYVIPDTVLNRYNILCDGNFIDYESINKNEKTNDDYFYEVSISDLIHLDPQFEDEILKDMNPAYSLLEKAIYIYYKLCELLSYDQDYYAGNQHSEDAEKHFDINRINNINALNNEVVSYEFIAIYSYFLKKLGIKYTVNNAFQDEYGECHSTISFKVGEYLVLADSTINILQNDMTSAKINDHITGMRLTNKNVTTCNKFLEIYNKVIADIYTNKQDKAKFDEALKAYKEKYAEVNLSKKDKLYMLFKEIGNTNLKGVDVVSVHSRIYEHIFKQDEDVSINFISSTINAYKDYNYTPLTIISVKVKDDYIYYQIDPNNPSLVETISGHELMELFESKDYAYLGKQGSISSEIPGLSLESRENYVR